MQSSTPGLFNSLSEAYHSLTADSAANNAQFSSLCLGPGKAYLISASSGAFLFLEPSPDEELPQSLHALASSGGPLSSLIHPEDLENYNNATAELSTENATTSAPIAYRISTESPTGWLPLLDYRFPVLDAAQAVVGYAGKLIEDHKQSHALELSARDSHREIAASAIRRFLHDFNNTIAGIYSLSELYSMPGSEMSSMLDAMGHICKSSTRAQGYTQKIKELIVPRPSNPSYHEIEQLVNDNEIFITALLPKGTEYTVKFDGPSFPVRLDELEFRKAIMHIASNAGAACQKNVQVNITCSASTLGEQGKPAVRIDFSDNGCGIADEDQPSVFLPNFTTKNPDEHPGMGLALVQQFAEGLGGEVTLQSQVEKGTTVSLTLPLVDLSATLDSPQDTSRTDAPAPKHSARTVLIYTWEDISRHPLLEQLRNDNWKYRIHLDPFQLMLDLKELEQELDGVIVFLSDLDDKAASLVEELKKLATPPKVALIAMTGKINAWPDDLREGCGLEASSDAKPSALSKKLTKYFGP